MAIFILKTIYVAIVQIEKKLYSLKYCKIRLELRSLNYLNMITYSTKRLIICIFFLMIYVIANHLNGHMYIYGWH